MLAWESFREAFAGYDRAYGTYASTAAAPDQRGKISMVGAEFRRGPVTQDLWEAHLEGRQALAVIPIDREQKARWGAIDVDTYGVDHLDLVQKVRGEGLPLVVARSKSGGAHAYLFLDKPYPAGDVRSELRGYATQLGLGGGVEIFPKQSEVDWTAQDLGSCLNLPYFGNTNRYAYDQDGRPLSLVGFLKVVASTRTGLGKKKQEGEKKRRGKTPEDQGPPCLEALTQAGFPAGTRHNALYNLGVYFKKAFGSTDEWRSRLDLANRKFFDGRDLADLTAVIKSLERRDYNYKCSEAPIVSHCNRPLCLTRAFGVSSPNHVWYSDLTKLDCEPPIYFLTIEGRRIRLTGEELFNYNRYVVRRVMEVLDRLPPPMTNAMWLRVLDELLADLIVIPSLVNEQEVARQALLAYVRRGRRQLNGAVALEKAQYSPLVVGRVVYVNWIRFMASEQRRTGLNRAVFIALRKALEAEPTEQALVDRIELDEELDP